MAMDQVVVWLAVTVSLATAAGRSRRNSEPKPWDTSWTRLVQATFGVKVSAPPILKASLVITSSPATAVAALVAMVAVVDAVAVANVPVWSSGAAARTPLHSVRWPTALTPVEKVGLL